MGRIARLLVAVAFVTTGAALTPPSTAGATEAPTRPAAAPPSLPELPSVDPASPSLSAGGRAMLETASLEGAPRYAVSATLDPDTGNVAGRMHARVRADDDKLEFRVLAGLPALRAGLRVRDVTVNNKKVQPEVDRALLRAAAVEVNDLLTASPEKLNEDPLGVAWLVKIKLSAPDEIQKLMSAADYQKHIGAE